MLECENLFSTVKVNNFDKYYHSYFYCSSKLLIIMTDRASSKNKMKYI